MKRKERIAILERKVDQLEKKILPVLRRLNEELNESEGRKRDSDRKPALHLVE